MLRLSARILHAAFYVTAVALLGQPVAAIELQFPVACVLGRTCEIQNYVDRDPSSAAMDYRCGSRTYDRHNGTDIRVPTLEVQRMGVDVLAAADGRVVRGRDGVPDVSVRARGRSAVEGRECGNAVVLDHSGGWETQYCHLAQGSLRVRPGEQVNAGQPLGRIGLSGMTEYPHLHFIVRHHGKVVDPFAFGAPAGSCDAGDSIWHAPIRQMLAYKARAVLNTGFAAGPVTMETIESGVAGRTSPQRNGPALVAFIRMIGGRTGDVQSLSLKGPEGRLVTESAAEPLDRDKAQVMMFVGKKTPPGGWPVGAYEASYVVMNKGKVELEQTFSVELE